MDKPTTINHIGHEEIAHLAYLNWQRDGGPIGRDQNYWFEAERQLQATKQLLARASNGQNIKAATASTLKPRSRSKAGATRLAR